MTCTDTTTSTLDTLNVHTLADPDQGPLFHIGGTCLDSDGARALIDHLAHLLEDAESTEDTPTAEATMPEQPRPGYMFPATRKWHGEQVPASHVHRYPTVDGRSRWTRRTPSCRTWRSTAPRPTPRTHARPAQRGPPHERPSLGP